jgi:hypothetical protein
VSGVVREGVVDDDGDGQMKAAYDRREAEDEEDGERGEKEEGRIAATKVLHHIGLAQSRLRGRSMAQLWSSDLPLAASPDRISVGARRYPTFRLIPPLAWEQWGKQSWISYQHILPKMTDIMDYLRPSNDIPAHIYI